MVTMLTYGHAEMLHSARRLYTQRTFTSPGPWPKFVMLDELDHESLRAVAALSSECYDCFEDYACWRGLANLARVSRIFLAIERDALRLAKEQMGGMMQFVHVRAFGRRPHWGLILHAHFELERTLRSDARRTLLVVRPVNDEDQSQIRLIGPPGQHHSLLLTLQDEARECLHALQYECGDNGEYKIDGLTRAWIHVLILKMLLFLDRVDLRLKARDEATHLYSTQAPERLDAELQDLCTKLELCMARPKVLTDLLRFGATLLGGGALSDVISCFELWWHSCADPDTWGDETIWQVDQPELPEQKMGMLLHNEYARCVRDDVRSSRGLATSQLLIHAMCRANVPQAHQALWCACLPGEALLHDLTGQARDGFGTEGKARLSEDLARWADLCEADGRAQDAERILAVAHAVACPVEQRLCARRLRREWRRLVAMPADMEARLPLPESSAGFQLTLRDCRGWHTPQPADHAAAAAAWPASPTSPQLLHGRSVRGRGGGALVREMGLVHLGLSSISLDDELEERSHQQLDLIDDMGPSGSGIHSCQIGYLSYALLGAMGPSRRDSNHPNPPRRFVIGRNFCTGGCWAGDQSASEDDECASCTCCMPCATAPTLGRLGTENGICEGVPLGQSFLRKLWRGGGLADIQWEGHAVEVQLGHGQPWVIGRVVGGDIVDARVCGPNELTPAAGGCPFTWAHRGGREWPMLEIELRSPSAAGVGSACPGRAGAPAVPWTKVVTDLGGVPFAWQLRKTKRCEEQQCACERYCYSWNVGETPRLQNAVP